MRAKRLSSALFISLEYSAFLFVQVFHIFDQTRAQFGEKQIHRLEHTPSVTFVRADNDALTMFMNEFR